MALNGRVSGLQLLFGGGVLTALLAAGGGLVAWGQMSGEVDSHIDHHTTVDAVEEMRHGQIEAKADMCCATAKANTDAANKMADAVGDLQAQQQEMSRKFGEMTGEFKGLKDAINRIPR